MSTSSALCTVSICGKIPMYSLPSCSSSSSSSLKTLKFPLYSRLSQLGSRHFTPWNGLRFEGVSISVNPHKDGKRAKCRGKGVYASLFGVGAPEALVIGVVALLVFGPKGLAEVARNLGKTLRAFQPTIRELQDVSKEFKSTLEREIGLDDDPRSIRPTYESNRSTPNTSSSVVEDFRSAPVADTNGTPSSTAYSSEEYLKITEEQLKAAAAVQQDVTPSVQESQIEPVSQQQAEPTVASSPPDSPVESEGQPQALQQDAIPPSPESKIESESHAEAAVRETTAATPSVDKPVRES